MDDIAAAAAVTKRTLYNHFDSKDTLIGAVLEYQNEHSITRFKDWIDPKALTSIEFVDSFFMKMSEWVSRPGWRGSGYTRLSMELADLAGHPARRAAHNHKSAVEDWLASELKSRRHTQSRELAQKLAILIEGAMTLDLVHSSTIHVEAARRMALGLLKNGL